MKRRGFLGLIAGTAVAAIAGVAPFRILAEKKHRLPEPQRAEKFGLGDIVTLAGHGEFADERYFLEVTEIVVSRHGDDGYRAHVKGRGTAGTDERMRASFTVPAECVLVEPVPVEALGAAFRLQDYDPKIFLT